MLVKIFLLELLLLEIGALPPVSVTGLSTLSSSSTAMVAQLCLCYYISTSPMSLMRGSLNLSLAMQTSLCSEFKLPASRLAFLSYLP